MSEAGSNPSLSATSRDRTAPSAASHHAPCHRRESIALHSGTIACPCPDLVTPGRPAALDVATVAGCPSREGSAGAPTLGRHTACCANGAPILHGHRSRAVVPRRSMAPTSQRDGWSLSSARRPPPRLRRPAPVRRVRRCAAPAKAAAGPDARARGPGPDHHPPPNPHSGESLPPHEIGCGSQINFTCGIDIDTLCLLYLTSRR